MKFSIMEIIFMGIVLMLFYYMLFHKEEPKKVIEEDPHKGEIMIIKKRRLVSTITTEMLRNELRTDYQLICWLNKSTSECIRNLHFDSELVKGEKEHKKERDEFYFQKHFRMHVRLSIKQTKP